MSKECKRNRAVTHSDVAGPVEEVPPFIEHRIESMHERTTRREALLKGLAATGLLALPAFLISTSMLLVLVPAYGQTF